MINDDYDGQWYPWVDGAYVFLIFVLQLRKTPGKNLIQETASTGDRTRARWVRGKQWLVHTECCDTHSYGSVTLLRSLLQGVLYKNDKEGADPEGERGKLFNS